MKHKLTACQEKAFAQLKESSKNIFITGVAGSGKSHLLRIFLKEKNHKEFPILASTGVAAILVGGRTFHSFFGLGIMEGGVEKTVEKALRNSRVKKRIREAKGIIIDEISMLSGEALDAAEWITSKARQVEDKPWGGLRVIAVGDFSQLPPVNTTQKEKSWAFQDDVWERTKFEPAILSTIVRTKDANLIRILNFIRIGTLNQEVRDFLNAHAPKKGSPETGTHLFPRKYAMEKYNQKRLNEIPQKETVFETEYEGAAAAVATIKKQAPIPEKLCLKKNAFIMIRQNDPRGRWVNGSLGYVESIQKKKIGIELMSGLKIYLEKSDFSLSNGDGKVIAIAKNFPINLAYATTIHKAQGSTFDKMFVDLKNLWEPGHAYVALSRVREAKDISIIGWTPNSFRASKEVVDFHTSIGFVQPDL